MAGGKSSIAFSIVIPTYNRPGRLKDCLAACSRLDYPRSDFEVLVVDDGGAVPAAPAVRSLDDRVPVTLLVQRHAGPAAARNLGAANARGRIVAFTDDDCAPAPTWLRRLEARAADAPDALIGGATVNGLPDDIYSTASQILVDYLYAYYNSAEPKSTRFFTSNNMAIPAADFAALGGFDTSFRWAAAEDRDFCDRWRHSGRRLVYAPDAIVYHRHALQFRSFWRQHFGYGRGASHFHTLRARRMNAGIRIEPPPFYLNLLRYPFSRFNAGYAWRLAVLMAVSQVANAAGFGWTRLAGRLTEKRTNDPDDTQRPRPVRRGRHDDDRSGLSSSS